MIISSAAFIGHQNFRKRVISWRSQFPAATSRDLTFGLYPREATPCMPSSTRGRSPPSFRP